MRKTSLLAMACTAAVMLTACGKDESKTSPASSLQVSGSSQAESVAKEKSSGTNVSYKEMLPDIQSAFPDGTVEIIRSGMYDNFFLAEVKGYKESEYDAYLDACKAKGFTDVQFDIHEDADNTFEARTADGKFYVSLQLLKDERAVLSIICGEREESGTSSN